MKKWVLKALIQKFISFLPGSNKINYWFQKYITKGVQLSDEYFSDKLVHAHDHLRFYSEASRKENFSSLEIGTGWYPVVPICMYLAGAGKVVSIDLSRLLNEEAFKETILKFKTWQKEGKLKKFEPYFLESRIVQLELLDPQNLDLEALLVAFNMDYRVGDARNLEDDKSSFDLIHSNNVFEHIYPQVLKEILLEFKRVLHPKGMMSHFIDMSDHFAHLDGSITIYNFLRFSESAWQRIDNSVQPQNRWRLADYHKLYQELELEIIKEETRPGDADLVAQLKLAKPYSERKAEDLAISHVHLVNIVKNA